MRLLLYILLLFAFNTKAQITSSVYSGARFGGVVDTGGGTYITLPGCSTQTQVTGVDYMKNDIPQWMYDWRNIEFYSDSTDASDPITYGSSACRVFRLGNAWMTNGAKYLSIFADADYDGEYETLLDNTFLLTTDSSTSTFWDFTANQVFDRDYGMVRVIAADAPLSNSCPTEVNGMVLDGYVEVLLDCRKLNYIDTIEFAACPYEPIYVPDFVAIPDSISFGGVYSNGYYKNATTEEIQLNYNNIYDYYYFTLDVSDWPDIDVDQEYAYFIFGSNDGIYYEYVSNGWITVNIDGYTVEAYVGSTPYSYYRVGFGLGLTMYPTWDGECLYVEFYTGDAVLTILDAPAELDN